MCQWCTHTVHHLSLWLLHIFIPSVLSDPPRPEPLEGRISPLSPEHLTPQLCGRGRVRGHSNILTQRLWCFHLNLAVGNNPEACYSLSCEERQPFWTQLSLSLVRLKIGASGTAFGTKVSLAQNHNCGWWGRLTLNLILYTRWFSEIYFLLKEEQKKKTKQNKTKKQPHQKKKRQDRIKQNISWDPQIPNA